MFSLCIYAPKGASYYPKNNMLQFYICYHKNYHATGKCHMKSNINFRDQAWNRPPAKCWVKDFILPHKLHAQNFYRRFWQPWNTRKCKKYQWYHGFSSSQLLCNTKANHHETVTKSVVLKNTCSWKSKMQSKLYNLKFMVNPWKIPEK